MAQEDNWGVITFFLASHNGRSIQELELPWESSVHRAAGRSCLELLGSLQQPGAALHWKHLERGSSKVMEAREKSRRSCRGWRSLDGPTAAHGPLHTGQNEGNHK